MRSACCLIAIAILCGACSAELKPGAQGSPSSSPSASVGASPTPIARPLTVSNSTPVIFFRDAANFEQIDGITWDGVVGAAPGTPDYHAANPSETLFGAPTEIRDRKGAVVARGTFGIKSFAATWADDEVHYCLMQPFDHLGADGVPATLMIGSSEGGLSAVLQVGKVYEQVSTYVASCSLLEDRAVVVQSGGQGIRVAQYWVVRISTRDVLWTHVFDPASAPSTVVASRDARLIAENTDSPSGDQMSVIYAGDGSEVARLHAPVVAFSWDGSSMVLSARSAPEPASVVRMDDRRTLWSAPPGSAAYVSRVMAQPNGGGLAIGLANPATPTSTWPLGYPPVDLYLLSPEGTVTAVLRKVYW